MCRIQNNFKKKQNHYAYSFFADLARIERDACPNRRTAPQGRHCLLKLAFREADAPDFHKITTSHLTAVHGRMETRNHLRLRASANASLTLLSANGGETNFCHGKLEPCSLKNFMAYSKCRGA